MRRAPKTPTHFGPHRCAGALEWVHATPNPANPIAVARDKTIHFVSLGCAKNRVDTEVMLGVSAQSRFVHVDDPAKADVIVVNTCGFIGPAKEESIDTIFEMAQYKNSGRCAKLVVTGCLSQRYEGALPESMPEVDHFLGSSDMLKLAAVLADKAPRVMVGHPADYTMRASDPRILTERGHSAFLKIAEGCNRQCSFCAIPSFRGKQRSRPIADCVTEAQQLADAGVVELNLISQDTIAYGRDLPGRPTLAALVEALAEVDNIAWVRLHYLYPETLTEPLIALLRDHPRVLPYIDMPLQHASDTILRRMKRGHGGERLYKIVDRLREAIDELVFRTTFLVGHPGETEADFDELCRFVEWARFDRLGVFRYSHEEGTAAHSMTDLVDEVVISERHDRLMALQQPISAAKLRARVGSELTVLVEGVSDESELLLQGRWWGQAPDVDGTVYLANGQAQRGTFRQAHVTDSADYDLLGDLIEPRKPRLRTVP